MHHSPLKSQFPVGGVANPVGHASPNRIPRNSISPGHQPNCEPSMPEFGRLSDATYSRMTQSYASGGLFSTGSAASLLPYHHGPSANAGDISRPVANNFAASKTKSLSLLVDRGTAEYSSGRRRAANVTHPPLRDRNAARGMAAAVTYERDQSLDRHVDRRVRHRSRDSIPDSTSRYHTIGGYGRENRGASAERDYPHMGARMLERGSEPGLMRSRSIDQEFVDDTQPVMFAAEDSGRRTQESLVIELQSQVNEVNRECAMLQRDLDVARDKLSSSMNSVRTFWSPELKRERCQRKDDLSRLALLIEQLRLAEVENRQHVESIKHLEQENHTLRDLSLSASSGTAASGASDVDPDVARKDRDRHAAKELKLLKHTIEEMELRIETQKQTLATRDESIRKLMDMLQAKGRSPQLDESSDEARHIRQLEQLLEQKESEMDSRVASLEKDLSAAKDELIRLRSLNLSVNKDQIESLKIREMQLKDKVEEMRTMLGQRDAEMQALKTKLDTLDRHHEDHSRHVSVLRQQITAKEEQAAMLQADLDMLRDRLREKDDALEKKSKHLAGLQMDKKRLETELSEVSDQTSSSDRQIGILNRKIESLEDAVKEKDVLLASTRGKLESLQADHCASDDTVSGLEELLADKDKQIERLREQRERTEQRRQDEIELLTKKSAEHKTRSDALQTELNNKQRLEVELREEMSRLKSERLVKETQINRMEMSVSEKADQIDELHRQLRQAEEQKLEMASKTSTEFDSRLADMRREMDECRGEAARVKVEASHLSAALREAEATKKSKDRQIADLQQQLSACQQKISTLTAQVEKQAADSAAAGETRASENGPDDASSLKGVISDREHRILELEEALRESIRITAQREVVMHEQQMKLEHTERVMESLQEEIDGLRKGSAETSEQLAKANSQLMEKDEDMKSMQADSKRQLVEVYEMKQEAILASISEKDAHIAVLEMAPNKKTENIEEVEKLTKEKLRLQQVLKDLTQSRMKLLQSRHQRSQSHDGSASNFYKSDSHEKLFQKIDFGTYFVYHNELLVDDDGV